jgi:hypothetical protein
LSHGPSPWFAAGATATAVHTERWESRDLPPGGHRAAPSDDGPRSCWYCVLSPDHHLSNSERRAKRPSCSAFNVLHLLRAWVDAKRPTWHSAQVGRVVPLPDRGRGSHSMERALHPRSLHRRRTAAARNPARRSFSAGTPP